MFGLPDKVVESIRNVFAGFPEIEKAIIYGSRAKGNYKNGSDIDLTFFGENLTFQDLFRIEGKLDELFLPYTFDLSIFESIENENLKQHINRVGKIFYLKNEG